MLISNLIKKIIVIGFAISLSAYADEKVSQTDLDSLAKDLTNPVADLITAPLEYNHYGKLGPNQQGTSQTLTFQPVILTFPSFFTCNQRESSCYQHLLSFG